MSGETSIPLKIHEAAVFHLKAPLEKPYRTTFGTMTHRQAVVIALTGEDGTVGIGESWINFPLWAPHERMAAFRYGYFPALVGREIADIPGFVRDLWNRNYRAGLQSATLGPTMQALCAVEAALWDIQARLRGLPLGNLFSAEPVRRVKMYGSGINPPFLEDAIREALDAGIDTFKMKLGYGDDEDRENIGALKRLLGPGARIAVDVNRCWSFDHTLAWMEYLRDEEIAWLEEPLSIEEQHRYPELLERTKVSISAGENFLIPPGADFSREGEGGLSLNSTGLALDMVQPAVVKNCCFSDAVRLMELVEGQGKKLCPHFLGSAPGMAATAHLASLSRSPYLEWDINPNPLRTSLFREPFRIVDGFFSVSDKPGIGWLMRTDIPESWITYDTTVSARK
jgi:L-alanine-DL-glutamate epimerase-like enolase superfamily enzyme